MPVLRAVGFAAGGQARCLSYVCHQIVIALVAATIRQYSFVQDDALSIGSPGGGLAFAALLPAISRLSSARYWQPCPRFGLPVWTSARGLVFPSLLGRELRVLPSRGVVGRVGFLYCPRPCIEPGARPIQGSPLAALPAPSRVFGPGAARTACPP